jgi:hypothetical protein
MKPGMLHLAEARAIRNASVAIRRRCMHPKRHWVTRWAPPERWRPRRCRALRDGVVPPALNLKDLDPEIDLDVVAAPPRPGDYR